MNKKYLIGGIGSLIFSIAVIAYIFPVIFYLQQQTHLTIFLFLSIGIISMGIGILEIYLQHRNKLSLATFILSLVTSSLLIIFYGFFQIPIILTISYEALYINLLLWGYSFLSLSLFIISFGSALILQKNSLKFQNLILGSGILILIYGILLFIFSYIFLNGLLESNILNILNRDYMTLYFLGLIDINYQNFLFDLFFYGRSIYLNGIIQLSTFLIKIFSFLPLGLIMILNAIIFLIEADIKIQ